ncbi:hypothetical protein ASF72_01535 [Arthrobacter sp. Leaf141]|uniref:ankyrin repeat domain-containing protein n=1 Tax=Arthrobacter sp. Leaf141 TaxID=1736273 RepID=UPI0007017060|nr:ankyrin repeat domain-containing protein [Arthrobacter sp. Leaf141]KQQ96369.1 hypothetical protein ASF72_01535 [Arthrobacter sp. Leaf141]
MAQRPDALHTLGFAVWSDDIALVRELLDAGTPVDDYGINDTAGKTPLMESVDEIEPFYDSTRVLLTRLLLSAGADVDRPDNSGRTALHYAVGAGRAAVELLLAAGADPNAAREGGLAPLHEAILRGNASAIEALCRAGANRGLREKTGLTPSDLLTENHEGFTPVELNAVTLLLTSE